MAHETTDRTTGEIVRMGTGGPSGMRMIDGGGPAELASPALTGEQMVTALKSYQDLQKALDRAMPDQIQEIEGREFRKKGYWRAIALAFNLTVEPIDERREVSGQFNDGRDNFGWVVTYRALHPRGRMAVGDGSCFAIEKARRFKCPHPDPQQPDNKKRTEHFPRNTCPQFDPNFSWRALPAEATEHNVRSHAHTRAFNRAVSNLVGFGEVSAEEIDTTKDAEPAAAASSSANGAATAASQPAVAADGRTTITDVKTSKGSNARGEWTLYKVKFADGRQGGTFSDSIGKHAINAKESGAAVIPKIEQDSKGFQLMGFTPLKDAAKAEQDPKDEPVSGPEKILTVRAAKTEPGQPQIWLIQTDKRQVVTDEEPLAQQATSARSEKVGLIPIFEVVDRTRDGVTVGKINKLKNWTIVETTPASGPSERLDGGVMS